MARAYTQALLDRATAYVARSLGAKRSPEGLAELASLYAEATGEPAGSCRQCQYADFVHSLSSYIREATRFLHPETMAETTYQIIASLAGETFVHPSWNKAVTSDNLTDEDAEFFIKHGYADAFVRKDGSKAAAKTETDKAADSEAVTKAKAATTKAEAATTKAEESLKTEKTAHGDTKKKLTAAEKQVSEGHTKLAKADEALAAEKAAHEVTKQQVADLQGQLTKALADLAAATKPTE